MSTTLSSAVDTVEAQKILDKHNCARRRYGLTPLVWDWQLAAHAQEHADRCIWNHASLIGLGVPGEGENLSLAMGRPVGVDGWLAEEPFYDCVNANCRPPTADKMCGHWTQILWHNTGRVGCGRKRCASLQSAPGFLNSDILVCRYTPPGNYVGQRMVSEQQCANGASNAGCGEAGVGESKVVAGTSAVKSTTEKPTSSYVDAERSADQQRDIQQPVNQPEGNLFRVGIDEDKFASEQERIARLKQAAGISTRQTGSSRGFAGEIPLYVPESDAGDYSEIHKIAPHTVVFDDPSSQRGYANAQQTLEKRQQFSTILIVIVSIIIAIVLIVLSFLTYRYREKIAHYGGEIATKINVFKT